MGNYNRREAVEVLQVSQAKMNEAATKEEALAVLKEAGQEVSYAPAFRCLVMGVTPEDSVKWREKGA